MNDPMEWPARELFWAGLAFDEEDGEALTHEEDRRLDTYFYGLNRQKSSTKLLDGTIVLTSMDPIVGMIWQLEKPAGHVIGFGIRAADETQARMSLGRANRILGRAGIDREATVWGRTIFATPKEGVTR